MINKYKTFHILAPKINPESGEIILRYALDDMQHFSEVITFPQSFLSLPEKHMQALGRTANALSLAAGVSYYKTYVPQQICVADIPVTSEMAGFFSDFYFEGLGEFACRNELNMTDLKKATTFMPNTVESLKPIQLSLTQRPCVLVGGGKDSLVSLEAIHKGALNPIVMGINPSAPILNCMKLSGCEQILIKRTLDPQLFELNQQDAYNGHVPVTGILSFIAAVAAIIYDFDTIVLSNERSANEKTTVYQGFNVNHQLSKSFNIEKDIAAHIKRYISPNITYFSFLRPLSELHIAKLFAKENKYDDVFTSCNGAHKLTSHNNKQWCLNCPKCHFTFLMLATAINSQRLLHIFGENLLDKPEKIDAYRELCGLHNHKPWECVGELEEAAAAIWYLSQTSKWQDTHIVKTLLPEVVAKYPHLTQAYHEFMTPIPEHILPPEYEKLLHAYLEE